jgi:hypothetical protein
MLLLQVSAFILFRLDYCNVVLSCPPKSIVYSSLAARVDCPNDRITSALQLRWLPANPKIEFKVAVLKLFA